MIKPILLGLFFGFSLYYIGANNSINILDMLRLRDMTLGKIIFFAIGFAAFLTGITAKLGFLNLDHFSVKPMHLGVILGALVFGLGFGTIGLCPGTCPASIASGNLKESLFTFIGGLFGAFFFSISYKSLVNFGVFERLNIGKITFFQISDRFDSLFNIGHLGLVFMGILFMILAYLMPTNIRK